MSIALPDVNVLVALFDPAHAHHDEAHRWFGANRKRGWATCAVTINGCIRVLSNPRYPTVSATPAEIAIRLRELCVSRDHHFWQDSVALTEPSIIRWSRVRGHQSITGVYLLAMAVRNHGRLATFDATIPLDAVLEAKPGHLALLRG